MHTKCKTNYVHVKDVLHAHWLVVADLHTVNFPFAVNKIYRFLAVQKVFSIIYAQYNAFQKLMALKTQNAGPFNMLPTTKVANHACSMSSMLIKCEFDMVKS